ncbi:transcription factor E2FB-like isoform X1 [Hibiscus syriacus]|uniref:Transcription factor E2FB-like isoform X1 n=1 Tax=Hibiscus syriacus TaxID=106335 RepID=A0A6A2XHA1_HIBSY|nr:transcription factor E2FB-like isoform X1 [Hibiscus syriacus]
MAITLPTPTPLSSTSFFNAQNHPKLFSVASTSTSIKPNLKTFKIKAIKEKTEEIKAPTSSYADEVTKNSKEEGEEKKSKGDQAKELLAKYGGAYLATSITLSLISFSLCYVLINAGVDVQALLQKVGISTDATGEKVGTFALAYAAHKAASPIRFPPTVALTPIVASWIGKKVEKDD